MSLVKRAGWAVVIAVPLLLMTAWVGKLEYDVASSPQIQLGIEGYDPRDLLSGHYLIYTVRYGRDICPRGADGIALYEEQERCVCFGTTSDKTKTEASWVGACKERPTGEFCRAFLKGQCSYDRFEANIEQFFISESRTTVLNVVPPNSSILVKVTNDGRGIVTGLLIDGKPYREYFDKAPP